jgi:hypothetical protein
MIECDRAFTRSDALAKHMRTVHETEALRPSDPIPKSMQPSGKNSRVKGAGKAQQAPADEQHAPNGLANGIDVAGWTASFPLELGFTAEEEAKGSRELFRLLRRQVHWAEEEGELLKRQCDALEELRKKEWLEKEVLLEQVICTEVDWHERRKEVLAGLAKLPSAEEIKAAAAAMSPHESAQSSNSKSANGQPVENDKDAAATLASLSQA